jgi:excisionase family DNA binding protein
MAPMKRPMRHGKDLAPTLSLQQLADRWAVPRREVRRLLQRGDLPFEQVCGRLRVPLDRVQLYEETRMSLRGSPRPQHVE